MQQAEDNHDRVRSKSKLPQRGLHIKSPPTDRRSPTIGSTERSRPRRHPPGAPPRSIVQCSGRGSNPLQRPIRQNSKSTKENRGEIISLQDNCLPTVRQGKGKGCSRTSIYGDYRSIRVEVRSKNARDIVS